MKAKTTDPIVTRALIDTVTNLGQLTKVQIRALDKAVRDGHLVKGKGGPFPMAKTVWAPVGYDIQAARDADVADMMRLAQMDYQKLGWSLV